MAYCIYTYALGPPQEQEISGARSTTLQLNGGMASGVKRGGEEEQSGLAGKMIRNRFNWRGAT